MAFNFFPIIYAYIYLNEKTCKQRHKLKFSWEDENCEIDKQHQRPETFLFCREQNTGGVRQKHYIFVGFDVNRYMCNNFLIYLSLKEHFVEQWSNRREPQKHSLYKCFLGTENCVFLWILQDRSSENQKIWLKIGVKKVTKDQENGWRWRTRSIRSIILGRKRHFVGHKTEIRDCRWWYTRWKTFLMAVILM